MNLFKSRIEMNRIIKEQQSELETLRAEKDGYAKDIAGLEEKVADIEKENMEYDKKYIHTGLECGFCYALLQEEFAFCPRCGKKIDGRKKVEAVKGSADRFEVEVDGGYALITQYNGFTDKKVTIPSHINGRAVIGIWNEVFKKCVELEEVVFEEGCRYIGKEAFAQCTNLKKVRLPKSLLEIGDGAFLGCAMGELAIPPNVGVIGTYAFSSTRLKRILLPERLQYISDGMLSRTSIEEIHIPQSVRHIGYGAFSDTKLQEIELPDDLYSIQKYAFDIPSLTKIIMHSNIKIIESEIFGKSQKPVVYCAAGGKAHLFARKHGLDCREIMGKPIANGPICATGIFLELSSITKRGNIIGEVRRYTGTSKAETWSWNEKRHVLHIDKCMNMDEAVALKKKLQNFVDSHSNWQTSGFSCTLRDLTISEHWGNADV